MFYLKKAVVLSAAFAAVLCAIPLLAFANNSIESQVPVLVVLPGSVEQPRDQAMAAVTVISAATIAASGANNVAELLRGQAGVIVQDLFGDGNQATIDLRGFGATAGSNTLILLDGRRLNNSTDNSSPDIGNLNINDIERIEILQGSAGVLYGNQAVGGVINIIRKKLLQDRTQVALKLGSYSMRQLDATINRLLGQTQLGIDISDTSSENYRDHNDSDKQRLNVRLRRQHQTFTSYAEIEITENNLLTPGALLEDELKVDRSQSLSIYQDDYFATDSNLLRLGIDKIIDGNASINIDFARRVDDREFTQTFRPSSQVDATQDRESNTLSTKYRNQLNTNLVDMGLLAGFQIDANEYQLLTSFGPQAVDQKVYAAYLSTQWQLSDSGQLQLGVRMSEQDSTISDTTLTDEQFDDSVTLLGLGYTWIHNGLKVYLRADQNVRYPTVEEHTNIPFGDEPGLKTQQGVSVEAGIEINQSNNRYRLTTYRLELDDEIAFDSSGFYNLNLDSTKRQGLIIETFSQWTTRLNSTLSLTLLDSEISSGAFKGNQLPLVPEQSLRLDSRYQLDKAWLLGIELILVEDQVLGGDFANQLDKLPSYTLVNGVVNWQGNKLDVQFRINNLLDEKYSETGSQYTDYSAFPSLSYFESYFPSPERNISLSLKYSF